jgi:hypothetical protein
MTQRWAQIVRSEEAQAWDMNISGVPAMVVNGKYLIPGAQEPETYAHRAAPGGGEGALGSDTVSGEQTFAEPGCQPLAQLRRITANLFQRSPGLAECRAVDQLAER